MRPTLAIAAVALTCGCGGSAQQSAPPTETTLPSVQVEVQNGWYDRRVIFAQWDGTFPTLLGEVEPGGTERFTIPVRGRQIPFASSRSRSRPRRLDPADAPALFFDVRSGDRFMTVITNAGRTRSARVTFD